MHSKIGKDNSTTLADFNEISSQIKIENNLTIDLCHSNLATDNFKKDVIH